MSEAIVITFLIAYFLGSIPFGLLIARAAGLGDVRKIGSGNIGATNVMRTGRKELGVITLLLDALKGFAAVWLVGYVYNHDYAVIAAVFAVLGHVFPVWLKFKGGKGVATAIGVLFGVNWMIGLFVIGAWAAVFAFTRISALAALLSIGYSALAAYLLSDHKAMALCLFLALFITYTHRSNIKRMLSGDELSFKKTS